MVIDFSVLVGMQQTYVDRVDLSQSHTDHFSSYAVQYSIFRFVVIE